MTDDLDAILDDLHAMGYEDVERPEGFEDEASGVVALPAEFRRERRTGWRRFLPRVYCDAGNPDLVPDDLRAAVEKRGWTVQAMGRDDDSVTVVISENGV